jgi:nucleotide-binding universal stress UspA family protein
VVVGVDGSVHSDAAVLWAASRAAATQRPLHLLHALGRLSAGELLAGATDSRELQHGTARPLLEAAERLALRAEPDLEVVRSVVELDPREALIASAPDAALTVVGTRGHGPVTVLALGSVSVAVAGHARGPVAVVRPRRTTARDVVVGVAGDGSDQAAVLFAAELAVRQTVPLDVVHAWSSRDTFVDTHAYDQRLDAIDEGERVLSEALAGLAEKYPDLEVRRAFPDRGPVRALVERSRSADCLVVGAREHGALGALIGSVSRAVVERAECTTVVVRS